MDVELMARAPSTGLRRDQLATLHELVAAHTGVQLAVGEDGMVEARLRAFLRAQDIGLEALFEQVRSRRRGPLAVELAEALTNAETSFFRDPLLFEELRAWLVPELLEARGRQPLVLWCGACSTGQEPYSLAMLLATWFPALLDGRLRIIASDVSRRNLERVREARYSRSEVNRGLPAAMLVRWFEAEGEQWRVSERLRALIELRHFSLLDPWPTLPTVDLLLLRNVLIYWPPAQRVAVLERAARQLAVDGYLAVGGAEILPRGGAFTVAQRRRWWFYRRA